MESVDALVMRQLRVHRLQSPLHLLTIDIAGDELTVPEVAKVLSRAVGHEVRFVQVPIEEVRKFSEDYAIMLEWFDRVGYDVDIARVSKESGIRPTPLAEWAATANWAAAVPV